MSSLFKWPVNYAKQSWSFTVTIQLKHGAVYSQALFPRSFSRCTSSSGFRRALYHLKSTRKVYFDFYCYYHRNWLDISFSFEKTSAYHRNLIANVDRINSKKISYPRFYTCCKKDHLRANGKSKNLYAYVTSSFREKKFTKVNLNFSLLIKQTENLKPFSLKLSGGNICFNFRLKHSWKALQLPVL